MYDEEIPAESFASHIRQRSDATAAGPRGTETRAAVMDHYGLAQNSSSQRFSDYPRDFALRITASISDIFKCCDDPTSFSILLVSFISGSGILSDDFVDPDTVEVLMLACTDAYVTACLGRKPSKSSIFLSLFDTFLSQARLSESVFSTPALTQVQKCQFFEKSLFKFAVHFLDCLISQMKKESISDELSAVFKYIFSLCADHDLSDDIKTSKLKPAMKILRACLSKTGGGEGSQRLDLGCESLLSALVSFVRQNSISDVRSYDFKCKLLSCANEWMALARHCTLDLYQGDEEFQPQIFQSTHPYADNRKLFNPSLTSIHSRVF